MLALWGFITIIVILILLITKKTTVQFALAVVPVVIAIIAGFAFKNVTGFAMEGLKSITATALTCLFATILFGILFDAGMFDPVIKGVIKLSGGDPLKIAIGTVVIGIISHLDGSATSTYLISASALLPIYTAINMNPLNLAVLVGLGSGVMNIVPWGGPTLRAATVLNTDLGALYNSLIPIQMVGFVCVFIVSIFIGLQERKAVGYQKGAYATELEMGTIEGSEELRRPKLFLVNVAFTLLVLVILIAGWAPSAVLFMMAVPLVLIINYKGIDKQKKRIDAHAINALGTTSIIFCAGIFSGVLGGTNMMKFMSQAIASIVPTQLGGVMQYLMVIFSVPFNFIFDPDSFYFGVLPVLSQAAAAFGVDPAKMARAAICGMVSVGTCCNPLIGSTWLLTGLTKVNLGDLQKKAFPIAFVISIVMGISGIAFGLI